MKSVYLINGGMDADAFGILSGTCEKELARRGVKTDARDGYGIRVAVDPSLANDTFRLLPGTDGAAVSGATLSAVFHGVGVLLRRLKPDGRGGFTPLAEAVTFTPVKPLRGMYFATHFGNFYHAAPIEEVLERVVLSAMRGYNELLVWFDMHHFASMEDPEAVALTERLHTVLQYANRVGMGASILMLANEGFSSSPVSLRARFEVENGYQKVPLGHYGNSARAAGDACKICRSADGLRHPLAIRSGRVHLPCLRAVGRERISAPSAALPRAVERADAEREDHRFHMVFRFVYRRGVGRVCEGGAG